jgi:hypothetical protein
MKGSCGFMQRLKAVHGDIRWTLSTQFIPGQCFQGHWGCWLVTWHAHNSHSPCNRRHQARIIDINHNVLSTQSNIWASETLVTKAKKIAHYSESVGLLGYWMMLFHLWILDGQVYDSRNPHQSPNIATAVETQWSLQRFATSMPFQQDSGIYMQSFLDN